MVGKLKEVGDDPAEEECANMVAQWSGQENNQIWTRTSQLQMHQIRSRQPTSIQLMEGNKGKTFRV